MAGTVSSRSSDQGLCRAHHLGKLLTRSFSKARVVSCLNMVVCCPTRERKSGNQLHKGRYGEWLALRQVIAGNFMLHYLFIHAWNHLYTINAVSSLVVVTCTLERIEPKALWVVVTYVHYE